MLPHKYHFQRAWYEQDVIKEGGDNRGGDTAPEQSTPAMTNSSPISAKKVSENKDT